MRYSPQLDGLRGTAILCVLTGHLFESHFRGAWVGVDIFFVLSGFLITNILIAEHESTGTVSLKNFYGRRALRLVPALLIGVALTGLLSLFGATPFHTFAGFRDAAVPALLYFSNFSDAQMGTFIHTWSLSVEEQFYLIWPLVVGGVLLVLKPRPRIALIVGLMATFATIRFSLEAQHIRWWNLYSWFYTRADVLMAGALVACAASAWPEKVGALVRKLKPLTLLAIPFVAYIFYTTFADQRWLYRWGLTATAVSCALIVFVAQFDNDGPLARVLRNKVLIWFGKHSYGIYVY
ncbi:MAG: Acyltransferase 3, partial [Verrucomicrobiales bacterium]|nr:Acyltransferase 3 [Verrucomicrobiales bacterium]